MTDRRAIQVGDLVMVVRAVACCGKAHKGVGTIFKVAVIRLRRGHCAYCRYVKDAGVLYALASHHIHGYSVNRLKRIPPLDELESTKTDEPMKEPA